MGADFQFENAAALTDASEAAWLTVQEAFERISRRECYYRTKPNDCHRLISKPKPGKGPKSGILVYAPSMSFDAQQRWREHTLAALAEPKPSVDAVAKAGQLSLLPRTKIDREIAALGLPESMKKVVLRRYNIVDLCLNHNWKSENYPSKRAYLNALAKANQTSARSIQRWTEKYRETGKLISLANELPGPEPYTGSVLDADMKAHLQGCWVFKKLNVRQCYQSLIRYLEEKQNSPGCRASWLYQIPSYPTVSRFIRSLSPIDHAVRQGPEALKAACGHIDRTHRDLKSLDCIETDEWNCDFFAYDAKDPKKVHRWWLLTFYDRRSMYPLVGKLVKGSEYNPKHGIREADEIEILVSLLKEYGVPGAIYSDHGRFRGRTFGGHARKFEKFDGILDRLGITKSEPRKKNPRGSRLERFHRFLADQSRTVPGWVGANTKERESAPGDEQKALHDRWVKGDSDVPRTPLLSNIEAMQRIDEWMKAWRDHPSEGTDMDGLSPRAVFEHNKPEGGFRRLSDEEIAFKTAEHIPGKLIKKGGIVKLRDGKRYSHPSLILIQRQKREIVRLRDDHSKIYVLPQRKGEEPIVAPLRVRVGNHDPENLAREMELQTKILKLAGSSIKPLELQPESCLPDDSAKALPAQKLEILIPPAVENVEEEKAMLRLHDIKPMTVEELAEVPPAAGLKEIKALDFADLVY